jgi:hypothetical protein
MVRTVTDDARRDEIVEDLERLDATLARVSLEPHSSQRDTSIDMLLRLRAAMKLRLRKHDDDWPKPRWDLLPEL